MSIQRFEDLEADIEVSINPQNTDNKTSLSTKLERRRRIEELNEEKMLREELGEF